LIHLRRPFLIVNPKAYLSGSETMRLAALTDGLAGEYDLDVLYTAQTVHLAQVAAASRHLIVTAQHLDPVRPGDIMGATVPEALAEVGVQAVMLNHASHPLSLPDLRLSVQRAEECGLATIVCADSEEQCRAVAGLRPTVVICEPTRQIGTCTMTADEYMVRTTQVVKTVSLSSLVVQAGGVSSGDDIRHVLSLGADGSGGTVGIVLAPDPRTVLIDMLDALAEFKTGVT